VFPGERVWKGKLCRRLSDADFAKLLSQIPAEIKGIGKTKVSASVTGKPIEPDQTTGLAKRRANRLETAACLHAPDDIFAFADELDPSKRLRLQISSLLANALRERETETNPTFNNEDLGLRFFAKQKRVGGYLAARYPIVDNGYYPWDSDGCRISF